MAASIEQKLDFLLKKIGYVASKTGIAEDSTLSGTKKAPFGEAIPSPLVVPANSVWAQASEIPATPPGADTPYVRVYLSGSSGHRMTVDNTVSGNRTFIARSTYNNNSSSILGDWIDTSFGADYIIEVYKGDPNSGGVKLSAAGSGSNDTWFFDYSSGVLNFNGTVVPSGVTSTNIYIVGYRYIGIKGVAVPGAGATFTHATIGDLNVTGVSTFFDTTNNTLGDENTGSVQLDGGMGIAKNLTVKQNLHVGGYSEFVGVATFKGGTINLGDADTDDINVGGEFVSDLIPDVDDTYSLGSSSKQWKNLFINGHAELDNTVISGVSTFTSPLDINTDVDIDGHTDLDNVVIAGIATFQSDALFGDADYIQMGDAQDLKIGHVGSYSVILDQGEGNLSIGGDGFVDIMNTALDEYKARFITNGAVELYWDNSKKLETTGYGVTVYDTLRSPQLNITGVSTYEGNADFNANVDIFGTLDVDGHTELDNLNVSGVSTFASNVDINADIDVDGHTNLDNVDIAGVTTTSGLLDINAGGQANTFIVEDLTDNRVVIVGPGGELEDDGNLTFDGSTLSIGVDLDVDGHTELDNVAISGVTTFSGAIDANGDLDVDGHTELDNLNVSGVSTFASDVDVNANVDVSGYLDVDGHTELDNVNVSGVSTFVGIGTFNSDLFVGGNLNVIGNVVYTQASATNLIITGVSTFGGQIDANGDLDVDGHTELDNLRVSGVSTFVSSVNINTDINVDGHTELDNVNISGVTTTSGLLDINANGQANSFKVEDLTNDRIVIAGTGGELEDDANLTFNGTQLFVGVDLDVDGHTELDNVNVSGMATVESLHVNTDFDVYDTQAVFHNDLYVAGNLSIGGTTTVILTQDLQVYDKDIVLGVATDSNGNDISTDDTANHGGVAVASTEGNPLVDLRIVGIETLPATYKKIMWFKEGSFSGLGTDAWLINYAVGIGSTQFPTGTRLAVGGIQFTEDTIVTPNINISEDLSITGNLDVDGHTDLDNISVAGVTTFAGNIDANGNLDVDGHTDLDNVDIAGVTTTSGLLDINAGGQANTFKVEDLTDNRIVLAGTGGELEDDANLTFDGSLFSVGTAATFTSGNVYIDDNLFVGGVEITGGASIGLDITTRNLDVTGIATFASTLDANGNVDIAGTLDVDGHTELDNVAISGVTTFSGAVDANANVDIAGILDVDGHTELDNVAISGVTTFSGYLDANANVGIAGNLDVDGHTDLDNVSISGVTTFTGAIDANGRIVGAATSNVIPFLYSTMGDLPDAGTYHGAFAHVHNQGKGYFAHGGNWYELVNKELNGTVGTGTERFDIGYIDATGSNVTGVSTAATSQAATLNVGAGGTVLTASVDTSKVGINSTAPAYALDVVGDINSSTDIKINGVSIVPSGGAASVDDIVALAIALG